ncbi:SRPBCC family protein [Aliikangiella coralliicola]|uniref:SRPBCC domain-containing protein n=1 Tax=Aliikangiella coralliicola TaxID=2592383 RepID=A0A545U6I1_9GAMM|nr:SRPBCC domain-containing protein [Aliikangiella coralliicola]TQV85081.1 SRPBCC domain-containing protein [Aliikangiella coralliicola]
MFELTINRKFSTSVNQLFEAWKNPEVMQRWFAPGDMSVPEASVDFRENGEYRIVMQESDGEQHVVGGTYKKIEENKTLVFSWRWEGSPATTLVALQFNAINESSSELVLSHSEFADQEACDKHEQGWNGCLANLLKLYP